MSSSFRLETPFAPDAMPNDPVVRAEYWQQVAEEQRAVLDALPTSVCISKNRQMIWVNRAFSTLLGYSPEEARIVPATVYFHDAAQFQLVLDEAATVLEQGETFHTDVLMRHKNGVVFWGNAAGRLLDPGRPDGGFVWMLTDISERKRAEEAQRLKRTWDRAWTARILMCGGCSMARRHGHATRQPDGLVWPGNIESWRAARLTTAIGPMAWQPNGLRCLGIHSGSRSGTCRIPRPARPSSRTKGLASAVPTT